MAQGVGVGSWALASPDFPQGGNDYAGVAGDGQESPYVTGPAVNGFADTTAAGTGPVHISTGANPNSNPAGRAQHWSNLFDWRNGPMFWLMLATIAYFGLISIRVQTRLGR